VEQRSIVNESEIEWLRESAPDGTALRFRKKLAAAAGGREIGASLYRMPPGEKPWPRHFHAANINASMARTEIRKAQPIA